MKKTSRQRRIEEGRHSGAGTNLSRQLQLKKDRDERQSNTLRGPQGEEYGADSLADYTRLGQSSGDIAKRKKGGMTAPQGMASHDASNKVADTKDDLRDQAGDSTYRNLDKAEQHSDQKSLAGLRGSLASRGKEAQRSSDLTQDAGKIGNIQVQGGGLDIALFWALP